MADFFSIFGTLPHLKDVKQGLGNIRTFSSPQSSDIRDEFPRFAAAIAKEIGPQITSTQLRRFYTYVKSVEMVNRHNDPASDKINDRYKLRFILPKIAGTGEKERKSLHGLYEILSICVLDGNKIQTVSDLRLFVEFFEAILDYHASLQKEDSNSNKGDRR